MTLAKMNNLPESHQTMELATVINKVMGFSMTLSYKKIINIMLVQYHFV